MTEGQFAISYNHSEGVNLWDIIQYIVQAIGVSSMDSAKGSTQWKRFRDAEVWGKGGGREGGREGVTDRGRRDGGRKGGTYEGRREDERKSKTYDRFQSAVCVTYCTLAGQTQDSHHSHSQCEW